MVAASICSRWQVCLGGVAECGRGLGTLPLQRPDPEIVNRKRQRDGDDCDQIGLRHERGDDADKDREAAKADHREDPVERRHILTFRVGRDLAVPLSPVQLASEESAPLAAGSGIATRLISIF